MEHLAPTGKIYQAGTLSGNPLAMTAGYETLSGMDEEAYDSLNKKADKLESGFIEAKEKYNIPLHINRVGSMLGEFFTNERVINFEKAQTSNIEMFAAYYQGMIKEGIFLPPSQFEGLFLSTAHTDEDIETTIQAIHRVFATL